VERSRRKAVSGGGSPADFGRFIEEEVAKWSALIKQTGLRVQ
jgi:tripartite-type tricarboxylate transporter receptor subunit TctC